MSGSPFISVAARDVLRCNHLDNFEALWHVEAESVDEPNRARGGISSVSRLTLNDANGQPRTFYLKRQTNYLIRNIRRPFGQPTAEREFNNIVHYAELGIPALEVACYAERREKGQWRALLLTPALEGYEPLDYWLKHWSRLGYRQKRDLIKAAAALVAQLHGKGMVHNSLYPKHIFLKPEADGVGARLIDLETSRAHLFSPRGYLRDLDALNRRALAPSRTQRLRFMLDYLGKTRVDAQVRYWVTRVVRRSTRKRQNKAKRHA